MRSLVRVFGLGLRRAVPLALRAKLSVSVKTRVRTLSGLDPWPDLAVRHPLLGSRRYRATRKAAAALLTALGEYGVRA